MVKKRWQSWTPSEKKLSAHDTAHRKGADQTARMRMLISSFAVPIKQGPVFAHRGTCTPSLIFGSYAYLWAALYHHYYSNQKHWVLQELHVFDQGGLDQQTKEKYYYPKFRGRGSNIFQGWGLISSPIENDKLVIFHWGYGLSVPPLDLRMSYCLKWYIEKSTYSVGFTHVSTVRMW